MTRLTGKNLSNLTRSLERYDQELVKITGCTLKQLACRAAGVTEDALQTALQITPVAVIPVTAGRGLITGFSASVQAIAGHLGFQAETTGASDVAGLHEAIIKKSGLILLADDNRFIAVNLRTLSLAENTACTALGYVTALDLMCKGLAGKNVLVIGCGELGFAVLRLLAALKAVPAVYDPDHALMEQASREIFREYGTEVRAAISLKEGLAGHDLLIDCSPAADIIDADSITGQTYLAAPGLPRGATAAARKLLGIRHLHDPLQVGTAVMLVTAVTGSPPG